MSIVSLRIVCGLGSQGLLFTAGQRRLQRFRYSFRDLGLDGKDVTQLSIVRLGPELRAGLHVNQADIDPYLIACLLDATLKDVRYAKLLRDLGKIARLALILLRGSARNHFQIRDFSQTRQDFLLDAISEISVLWIAAQILKGQDRD